MRTKLDAHPFKIVTIVIREAVFTVLNIINKKERFMEINFNSHSKNIKFNAHSGGSFEYEESEKAISIKAEVQKALVDFMSKASAFVLRIYVKIRSKFSS